jgi:toxin ParE1/3/4
VKIIIRSAAKTDILEQVTWYLKQYAYKPATDYPEAVNKAIEFIAENPLIPPLKDFLNPRLSGLRSWPIPGFESIRIYYQLKDNNTILILRILHGKRHLEAILEDE